jgi:glycerate 2-kinase
LVVTHDPQDSNDIVPFQLLESSHPIPDERSLQAGKAVLSLVKSLHSTELLLCLLSGGASALVEQLPTSISLSAWQHVNQLLINCGASIVEINLIRSQISNLKGGKLAQLTGPHSLLTIALSDIVEGKVHCIGSGPTLPAQGTPAQALKIIDKYGLRTVFPACALSYLEQRTNQESSPNTATQGPRDFVLLADNLTARHQVCHALGTQGYQCHLQIEPLVGNARSTGTRIAQQALLFQKQMVTDDQPTALVFGGETTVHVVGKGKGGRNQEVALSAAQALEHSQGITIFSLGTDGCDGPTEAAGAMVDGHSAKRAYELGFDIHKELENNNAFKVLEATGDLLFTGQTHTNLADLTVALIHPRPRREAS